MNTAKAIKLGNPFWEESLKHGLINIVAQTGGNGHLIDESGHEFINMCSYSYLGLDSHSEILKGAANAILDTGALNSSTSRVRLHFKILRDTETALSTLFDAEALTTASCAAAATATLPLIASGLFTGGIPPVMIYDKNAHFCLNLMKPICADETNVLTAPHNDLNFIEDACKRNKVVAYVADGVYSTGGHAPVKELLALQEKYGLFLFFDEAHGISAFGKKGRGYVLEEMGGINERTIIVASLNKGFGASGGMILLGPKEYRPIVTRFGGPLSWSQRINIAGLGAILASVRIHHTPELTELQNKLQQNINYFDAQIHSETAGDGLPIRFISIGDENKTVEASKQIFREGFYTSPLFFPVIARGRAGLRIMLRADLDRPDLERFCQVVKDSIKASELVETV